MHCYSESLAVLPEFLAMGFMIGFDGPITFKKSEEARQVWRKLLGATSAGDGRTLSDTGSLPRQT